MEQTKIYKAIDLLDKVLEFTAMTPSKREWNHRSLNNNKPRQVRLQRINALLKAFAISVDDKNMFGKTLDYYNADLEPSISSLLNGSFIKNRPLEEYKELIEFSRKFLQQRGDHSESFRPVRHQELLFIYPKMIDYKLKVRELLSFNSGWLEVSSAFAIFHIHMTNSISANLVNKYDDLDHAIELFINPGNLSFTEAELIANYNYPTDNLDQIDMDNW